MVNRVAGLLLAIVVFVGGCELLNEGATLDLENVSTINFGRHVQPILDLKCGSCHSGQTPDAGLSVESWEDLTTGSANGEALIPFDADNSLMIELATKLGATPHPVEVGGDTLSAVELEFLTRWINEGAKDSNGSVPFEDATNLIYVANQSDATVSVIDTDANVVIRTIDLKDLGFSDSARPHHVAVEPDGAHWYVSLIGENKVLKFTRQNDFVGQADFESPGMLAIGPANDLLFVGRSLSAASPPPSIGKIVRTTMAIEEVPVLFPRPHALAVEPSGEFAYSASLGLNRLMTINISTSDVSFVTVTGPTRTFVQHAISPKHDLLITSSQSGNSLYVFDISNPASIDEVDEILVNAAPWHPIVSMDGETLYVGNNGANTVTVMGLTSLIINDVITGNGLSQPHGSGRSTDGRYIYISNRNADGAYQPRYDLGDNRSVGTVVVIDTNSNEIVKVLEVGKLAVGIGTR